MSTVAADKPPDAQGHFGPYGGRYVPETLMYLLPAFALHQDSNQ